MSDPERFAAFLGSINVGGHRATGDELCAAFESLGLVDVATFLASGNVIFATGRDRDPDALTDEAASALEAKLGFAVPVYLRSAAEVREIAGAEPFDDEALDASTGKPQVMLLREAPGPGTRETVEGLSNEEDRLVLLGRELHWLPSGGISESGLDTRALAAMLGPSTTRTHNTIQRIAKKFLT